MSEPTFQRDALRPPTLETAPTIAIWHPDQPRPSLILRHRPSDTQSVVRIDRIAFTDTASDASTPSLTSAETSPSISIALSPVTQEDPSGAVLYDAGRIMQVSGGLGIYLGNERGADIEDGAPVVLATVKELAVLEDNHAGSGTPVNRRQYRPRLKPVPESDEDPEAVEVDDVSGNVGSETASDLLDGKEGAIPSREILIEESFAGVAEGVSAVSTSALYTTV